MIELNPRSQVGHASQCDLRYHTKHVTSCVPLPVVLCQEALEQCPYDRHHRVPARSMDKHKRSCSLRTMGYSSDELVTY